MPQDSLSYLLEILKLNPPKVECKKIQCSKSVQKTEKCIAKSDVFVVLKMPFKSFMYKNTHT